MGFNDVPLAMRLSELRCLGLQARGWSRGRPRL
jgi:hypothetical protein